MQPMSEAEHEEVVTYEITKQKGCNIMAWFDDTFLTSIFERDGTGKSVWLSARQTSICTDRMQRETAPYQIDAYGTIGRHDRYTYEWRGRRVILEYSKKNGCGCIRFGANAEEEARNREEEKEWRDERQARRIERIRRHPDQLTKELKRIDTEIESWQLERDDPEVADKERQVAAVRVEKLLQERELYTKPATV